MLNDPYYRASQYPYQIPDRSYVMERGNHKLVTDERHLEDLENRTPVLAVGSNLSPQQLARKFPDPDKNFIPVTKIKLSHFDSVYSTHFTGYGSIPATLYPAPDTEVSLFINWLDDDQLLDMHKTEIPGENYHFCRLNNIEAAIENGPALDHVFVYLSSRGALGVNGAPVPLAEITAQNRQWSALAQLEIQDHARTTMAPELSLTDFITQSFEDHDIRQTRTDLLNVDVIEFHHEDYDIITTN